MMLEDQPTPEDVTVESRGIGSTSTSETQYLTGSEIDYLDTLMGLLHGEQPQQRSRVAVAAAASAPRVRGQPRRLQPLSLPARSNRERRSGALF